MDGPGWRIQNLVLHIFEGLLNLYPPRFRGDFSTEVRAVFISRMGEAQSGGGAAWLGTVFQEFTGLVISILGERWHEMQIRKGEKMVADDQHQNDMPSEGGGMPALQPAAAPGVLWLAGWTLLTTAAIPAALLAMAPLAVVLIWLRNLGVNAGLWPTFPDGVLEAFGFMIGYALVLAAIQWFFLRRLLPRAWGWFVATGAGVLLGGLAAGVILGRLSAQSRDPLWMMAGALLSIGVFLGLAQWLYLRRVLPNSFWVIIIDVLAAAAMLLVGRSLTSLAELLLMLLPGAITGLGVWLLVSQPHDRTLHQVQERARRDDHRRLSRLSRVLLGLAALVPLFFACSWIYTASQLALAKNEGIYATAEEGMRAMAQESYSSDYRVKIISAGPNSFDGSQPHVWYVTAEVRASSRADGSELGANGCDAPGSFFIQSREGWVHVPEGAFPELVGFWMKVYGWAGEGQPTPSTERAPDQSKRFCQ